MAVTREVFWSVSKDMQYLFYGAAALSTLLFLYGMWRRMSLWTKGRAGREFRGYRTQDFLIYALRNLFSRECLSARRSFSLAGYRGLMLILIVWGFLTLFAGTALLTIHHYFTHFLEGRVYLIYSMLLDLAGGLLLIGLLISIGRRHLVAEVRQSTDLEDLLFLYTLLFIAITGFAIEGLRLLELSPASMDYSFIGAFAAALLRALGANGAEAYTLVWSLHVTAVLILIAALPYSKFFHMFSSQITTAAARERYGGASGDR
ncbi:MAG: hypothetical protein D6733_04590 [Methanobacteriota archaeon]|nr:MAG: hypothetical protein D6733_04590 [Euryarchaeota archaeon]